MQRNHGIDVKGNSHMISPDRTRLISILLSNSRLPGHLSPDLWHSMLIILILLIHATTRQQWNASWQSKRRRSAQIMSTAIVTVGECRPRNSNGNETGREATRRASLPCARVKTVKHSNIISLWYGIVYLPISEALMILTNIKQKLNDTLRMFLSDNNLDQDHW